MAPTRRHVHTGLDSAPKINIQKVWPLSIWQLHGPTRASRWQIVSEDQRLAARTLVVGDWWAPGGTVSPVPATRFGLDLDLGLDSFGLEALQFHPRG